jgi:hypothetical protein
MVFAPCRCAAASAPLRAPYQPGKAFLAVPRAGLPMHSALRPRRQADGAQTGRRCTLAGRPCLTRAESARCLATRANWQRVLPSSRPCSDACRSTVPPRVEQRTNAPTSTAFHAAKSSRTPPRLWSPSSSKLDSQRVQSVHRSLCRRSGVTMRLDAQQLAVTRSPGQLQAAAVGLRWLWTSGA